MSRLYPVGRGIKRLTAEQFLALRTVNQLDPDAVRMSPLLRRF